MRSERKRKRSLLAKFMVLFMIINLLSGVNPSVVKADETKTWGFDNNGKTAGNQQVRLVETGVEDTYEDGKFDVKLEVEGSVETIANNEKLDIVLVVDRSGSMNSHDRMENAKKAAKNFVDKLIDGGNGKVRIGLVSYAGVKKDKYGNEVPELTTTVLQDNSSNLNSIINGYNAYSGKAAGTFTQAALREANKLFENNDNEKIIVLISDGLPTYSYNNKTKPDYKQIQKANKNEYKEGYEIWSVPVNENGKLDTKEWKKGYRADSYETGWFLKTKWTYVPYYVKLIPLIEGKGGSTSVDDKARTISEAKSIKDKGVRIFSVGIGVDNEGEGLLRNVASQGHYSDANGSASDLGKLLNEIADQLKFAVSNADLELVMNDKVEFKNADDLKKIEVKVENKNSGAETADKSRAIKKTAKWDATTKTLSFSGITLDKDEVLNIKYKAELVETYKDGGFKPLNASAVLYPKGKQAESDNKLEFNIPNVKDMKTVNLTINKQWVGGKVPAGVESVKFNINAGNTELEEVVEVRSNENWIGKYNALPKYKDGTPIAYAVKEVKGANYEIVGEIKKDATSEGFTFTATNRNTETINFTVKKDWSTTPDELKIEVAVKLYANGKYERTENIIDDEAIFKNLPKYDVAGNEIKYTVKEALDNGKEEENGMITFGEYTYNVKYSYNDNGATITNTSTNASKVKFEATVKKHWVGGASVNDLNVVFKNKDKEYPATLFVADYPNGEWDTVVELPKYNDDNTLATYTVTEEKVEGYTANEDEVTGINANNPIAEFTNKRNTKNITVIKEWKDTPESLKKGVEVVLTENGEVSNRKDAIKKIKNDAEHKVVYTNLPETDTEGDKIVYSVIEKDVEAGFEPNVTKDNEGNIVVTNTYKKLKEDTISVTLKKVWVGGVGNNATFKFINKKTRDAQLVVLSADTKGLNKNDDKNGHVTWTYEVKNLRKYDDEANLIDYIVEEVTNKAYALKGANSIAVKAGDTATFTNVRVERKLTLKKEWISEDKVSVTVNVAAGEINFDILLGKENGWKYDKLLPVYDVEGNPIRYTITEKEIKGYKADDADKILTFITPAGDTADQVVTFTNTKMIEKPFTVHKTWVGEPVSKVSFGLFDGTNIVDTLELSAENVKVPAQTQSVWEGTFKGEYPEYKLVDGKAEKIQYEVKELDADKKPVNDEVNLGDRTFKVARTPAQGTPNTYNFTNKDITKTDISVTKTWVGKVPDSGLVHFGLFKVNADGLELVNNDNYTLEHTDSSVWTVSFNGVPAVDEQGNKITYAIKEVFGDRPDAVNTGDTVTLGNTNYKVSYDDKGNITNTEIINFTVKKDWSTTPKDLKFDTGVKIYADGKEGEYKDFENDMAVFEDLPKCDATGREIKYTVKEMFETGKQEENGQITFGEYNYKVDYAYTANGATITNTSTNASKVKFEAIVKKHWVGGASLSELKFVVKNDSTSEEHVVKMSAADFPNENWETAIELPQYNDDNSLATYTVTEEKVEGYTANKDEVTGINAKNKIAEFTNTRNTKNITVIKEWKDTPESLKKDVEVVLTENGKVSNRRDAVRTIKNDTEHKVVYTNLPETDTEGNKIDYSVRENNVETGFDAGAAKDNEGNIVVTNTYKKLKEDTISVNLNKVWRESVGNNATFKFINKVTKEELKTLTLTAETKGIETVDDKEGNITWKYKVKDLRKYDDNAKLIEYVVVEDVSNPAFKLEGENTKEVADGGTVTFTNVRVKGKLTLKKNWIAKETSEAYFVIEGNEVPEIRLAADNNWEKSVYLFAYDLEGSPIQYTITEKKIDGYKADETSKTFSFVDSANKVVEKSIIFTNTQMLENQFTVHKTWVGEPAESISFGLFEEGSDNKVDTLKLTAKDGKAVAQAVWEGKFEKVQPKYKLDGDKLVEIKYVVKELDEAGIPVNDEVKLGDRTFKVAGTPAQDTPNTYNFTNKDITKTDISVTKTWFGKVPESGLVHFGLFNVTAEGLVQVDKENYEVEDSNSSKWKVTFKNVASVDENGNKINYVIKEVDGEANALKGGTNVKLGDTNYKVSYDDKGNITNTELINLTVNKEWGKNVPEIAKQSVKFRITDDSRSDMNGKSFLLYEANGWTKSFENLPLYNAKGEKINYTVVETEINGDEVEPGPSAKKYYHSAFEITAEDAENITKSQTITIKNNVADANNEDPDNRTINVVKGWSSGAERKPVTVKLYQLDAAKGEIVPVENGETELRVENFWQAEFEVPKKDKDGNEILYYAFETAVGDVKVDESKLSPNMYNEGYQIGEYEVSIAELTSDEEGAEIGNYGFYILNTAHNKEVKPEEKVTVNVKKKWLVPTDSEYVKPVNVRLFTKKGEYLIPVSDVNDLTLDANNNWEGKFTDLDKYNDDNEEIEYYVAEVGVGDYTKEIISLDQISGVNGYTIGRYNVTIDGNGTNDVVITNDVALIEVTAVKNWIGATPRQAVEFTLYSKQGGNLVPTGKTVILNGTDENTVATFTELPRLDNNGNQIIYYVYETKIGATPITFNPTAVETMNYSVSVDNGTYTVAVIDNGTVGDKAVIISNLFTGVSTIPLIPVVPDGNTPVGPGVIPTPGPNPSTPVVDVPDVPSPQGPATPIDGDDEDGFEEIDEDDIPQDGNIENTDDVDEDGEETTDITDNKAPKGTPKLPKTGGETGNFLSIIGLGLIGLGLVIRRRR